MILGFSKPNSLKQQMIIDTCKTKTFQGFENPFTEIGQTTTPWHS